MAMLQIISLVNSANNKIVIFVGRARSRETSVGPRAKRLKGRKGQDVEEASRDDVYLRISQNLDDSQVRDLRNYLGSKELLPVRDLQRMDPHQMCNKLEQRGELWKGDPSLLERLMRKVGRDDFADEAKGIAAKEMEDLSDSAESSDD
ncbi:uncharacterized protein [Branchiostoma lanceolatum]|uniref:uncharacterized protein n=1 Tax=Branchiostoma lanceolatum TaxID=7740 RepID=UPI003451586F